MEPSPTVALAVAPPPQTGGQGQKRKAATTISRAQYHQLVQENLNGVYPSVAPPPSERVLKAPRAFPCDHPGCGFVGTSKSATKRHMGDVHGIGVQSHPCDVPGCTYVGKWKNHLRQHKQKAHDIDVVWHVCDVPGCDFKTKTTVALRGHKANKHDIGVVWQHCQVPGCAFKCKQRRNLFQHAHWMHSGRSVLHKSRVLKNTSLEAVNALCALARNDEEPERKPKRKPTAEPERPRDYAALVPSDDEAEKEEEETESESSRTWTWTWGLDSVSSASPWEQDPSSDEECDDFDSEYKMNDEQDCHEGLSPCPPPKKQQRLLCLPCQTPQVDG